MEAVTDRVESEHGGVGSVGTRAFSAAYEDFCRRVDRGGRTPLDPYAAESPGEFFAVLSEAFFERPEFVREMYPDVYAQLAQFYRQDPYRRQLAAGLLLEPSP